MEQSVEGGGALLQLVQGGQRRVRIALSQSRQSCGLTATLGSWIDHVRLYGNAGAHPDLFGRVSLDEANDVARLTETLIELLYITPAKIAQRLAGLGDQLRDLLGMISERWTRWCDFMTCQPPVLVRGLVHASCPRRRWPPARQPSAVTKPGPSVRQRA